MARTARFSKGCVFCEIVQGHAPAYTVYEDVKTIAFLDLFPITRGHVLVVPKDHVDRLADLPAEDFRPFFQALVEICRRIEKLSAHYNVGLNQGSLAGQIVFHTHFHVIPRYGEASPLWATPRNRLAEGEARSLVGTLSSP
jgi:histidine triad (HIT) family protein